MHPIVLIAYNRYSHFVETLDTLSKNLSANKSEIFIFIDGPKNKNDLEKINQIYNYSLTKSDSFLKLNIIKRPNNFGLAKNIISSVNQIINKTGAVIVLEDDIITSPNFLNFMNDALNYYEDKKKVWHINAHIFCNDQNKSNSFFLWRLMNCWGWGTWKDRWQYFDDDIEKLLKKFSQNEKHEFNIDGSYDFWLQVKENKAGLIKTWAIFWYATIFLNRGLCLSPYFSFTKNIGLDGSGVNSGTYKALQDSQKINFYGKFTPVDQIQENTEKFLELKEYYKKNKSIFKVYLKNLVIDFIILIKRYL